MDSAICWGVNGENLIPLWPSASIGNLVPGPNGLSFFT
ncbi:hypothetical protein OP10G_3168 [Fimbriimonas ginsengisoli Gsoil 348]|uniref:Uncharacterized protein n=1 Tax=Fimbriimonas ginsengisoli Gsoil 348 TaxID=661478 RepID=A0A068NSY8_FIMGI|nr:hypothetical protein OP10G_3168 [Fimbriimonas ginsengisoli Gsoil 348]